MTEESPLHSFAPENEVSTSKPSHVHAKKRKRSVSRRRIRRARIGAIVLSSFFLIAGLCMSGLVWLVNSGEASVRDAWTNAEKRVGQGATSQDAGYTVVYKGETYQLREDVVSVAIIGYDKGAGRSTSDGTQGQADGLVVLAIDPAGGKATLIGLPRDSMVDVGEFAGDAFLGQNEMQICLAFSYGKDADSGAILTTEALSHLFYGMPISYYLAMDMDGIGALADAVDGVPLTPIETIPDTEIEEGEPTVLYGKNVLSYLRYRDMDSVEGSLNRQHRQVQFAQELASRSLDVSNGVISRFVDLYSVATENSVTNLGLSEYAYLASKLIEKGVTKVETVNLEVERVEREEGKAAYYLNQESLYESVLGVYYEKKEG